MSAKDRWNDDDFIQLMVGELDTALSHDELAQIEANADFRTEQQSMRMGISENFSNY
ncbi:hypothetical protein [Citrobacter koseri]|uniref:hypothetical protein n=1 Tax=Citrobacter koseri TaxID=545 RepID=UPI0040394748